MAELELHDAEIDEPDIDGVLGFARSSNTPGDSNTLYAWLRDLAELPEAIRGFNTDQ